MRKKSIIFTVLFITCLAVYLTINLIFPFTFLNLSKSVKVNINEEEVSAYNKVSDSINNKLSLLDLNELNELRYTYEMSIDYYMATGDKKVTHTDIERYRFNVSNQIDSLRLWKSNEKDFSNYDKNVQDLYYQLITSLRELEKKLYQSEYITSKTRNEIKSNLEKIEQDYKGIQELLDELLSYYLDSK